MCEIWRGVLLWVCDVFAAVEQCVRDGSRVGTYRTRNGRLGVGGGRVCFSFPN